jgi:PAT family beta-lactamase induction signal transducer AmpG
MSIPTSGFFQVSLALLWVAAFASSTQDICADGIYLTALDKPAQAKFAGVQGMFWVSGKVLATGGFIFAMTSLQAKLGWSEHRMWQGVMCACAAAMIVLFAWHYWFLPTGSVTERPTSFGAVFEDFGHTAVTFFHKRAFWGMMAFVCLYRLGEGLILMEGQLFLRSATAEGGLGLSAGQVSQIDAIFGTVASIVGGLLGGWFAGKRGLSRSLWVLALFLNVPHLTYVALSHVGATGHGASYGFIASMVSIEKFGYGFGMVGNMIYMMQQLAPGRRTMTHYAFATALMNLMLVPTNMISGPLAELLGFSTFFLVVMFASVPSVWAAFKAPFPLKADEEKTSNSDEGNGHEVITVDDPTRLSAGELEVQRIAGRASMFTILNVLSILVLDAMILGWLHGNLHGTAPGFFAKIFLFIAGVIPGVAASAGQVFYAVLVGCALMKAWLGWKSVHIARGAIAEADMRGEKNYRGNARGAIVATAICGVLSVAVLYFGAKMLP